MPENVQSIIVDIEQQLKGRYDEMACGNDDVLRESNLIILIINNKEAIEFIGENSSIFNSYKNIVGKYKNMNVCVLFGDYENTNISYSSPDLVKNLRDARHFLYFDDIANLKILDMPLATMRQFKKQIDVGDAYYIKDNECTKVKTAIS